VSEIITRIHAFLAASGFAYEVIACPPEDADTAVFVEKHGHALEDSVNAILVRSKTGEEQFVLGLVLAHTRLDVNKVVRKRMGVRKVSFASMAEAVALTGMESGGVTPFCLPDGLPVWVDSRIMERPHIILGGGDRVSKIIVQPGILETLPSFEVIKGLAFEAG
jgi:prolyl-tRNA editing enzyme YbaK/EbsC (Cys-tRNA(Pro) deacylase)